MQQSQNEKEIKRHRIPFWKKSHHLPNHQNPNVRSASVLLPETLSKPN